MKTITARNFIVTQKLFDIEIKAAALGLYSEKPLIVVKLYIEIIYKW